MFKRKNMKGIALLAVLIIAASGVFASDEEFDAAEYKDASMNCLIAWSCGSLAAGAAALTYGNQFYRSLGIQCLAWGAIDLGIAVYAREEKEIFGLKLDTKQGLYDLFFINFLIDIAYMAAGAGLWIWGNEELKGHGAGILLQGGFLFAFDGINALILSSSF